MLCGVESAFSLMFPIDRIYFSRSYFAVERCSGMKVK